MSNQGDGPTLVEAICELPGVTLAAPAPLREVERVEAYAGARLPSAHRALLLSSNGAISNWGYERLFGVGDGAEDIGPWNAYETWKFAWPRQLEDFLAFGQTGWGDQYAYRLSELQRGVETVHRLDHFMMEAADEPVATGFGEFLLGFASSAGKPDGRVQEARRQIGDLDPGQLAVYAPSPLLVGLERATHLTKMYSRAVMVTNGDMLAQLGDQTHETRRVERLDTFLDDLGRHRVKVRWAR
ncbi:MAG TPA: SMI1/KNR4 family protein [Candidatus Limnocylindrales bacterium]